MNTTKSLKSLAKMIDHSLLHPTLTDQDIIAGCELSKRYDVATACIKPYSIELACEYLQGSDVHVCAVIAFPHGNSSLKIKRNEAIGKSVFDIFPSAKANGFFATLQNVLEFEKPVEHSASKYNNGWVSGWLKNYVYKLPSGEIAVLFLDVTKHKEAEFELRRAYEDLELKIAAKLSKQEAMDEGLAIQI